MRFADNRTGLRIVSGLNNFRARFFSIAFGDQAQFFRMTALSKMGGFPPFMLMEDVELSYRLKKIGPPLYLPAGVQVSGRRWATDGMTGNAVLVLALFLRYILVRRFFGSKPVPTRGYYQAYYAKRGAEDK
jgi:GT2 family glycosyltransferase